MTAAVLEALRRRAIAEEITSAVRHDVRNKLASIRNAGFFLKKRARETDLWTREPRMEQFHSIMESELAAAESILAERIRPAGLPDPRREAVDLGTCARAAAEALGSWPGIGVEVRAAGSAVGDPDELALVLLCLLENAAESVPGGGIILVEDTTDPPGIAVVDPGPGIPAEIRATACDAFVSRKPGHAGLGLAIARRLAARSGASIAIADAGSAVLLRFRSRP